MAIQQKLGLSTKLSHRLILTPEAELQGRSGPDVLREAMASVPVPQRVDAED